MKPGDLILIVLPERVNQCYPYNTFNNCHAIIVKKATLQAGWSVLVNGAVRDIDECYLRCVNETG
jgi:hypothetical protein